MLILKLLFLYFIGKSQDVTNEMTVPWGETTLPTILSRYNSRDIFNADELGLFYKALYWKSNKPRCFKGIRSTPCRYRAQKKSWMISELFEVGLGKTTESLH